MFILSNWAAKEVPGHRIGKSCEGSNAYHKITLSN